MTHRFRYQCNVPASGIGLYEPGYSVEVTTEAETVDELLDAFQKYLKACGFEFGEEEYFMSHDPKEERDDNT